MEVAVSLVTGLIGGSHSDRSAHIHNQTKKATGVAVEAGVIATNRALLALISLFNFT